MNKVFIFLGGALSIMMAQRLLADEPKWWVDSTSSQALTITTKPVLSFTITTGNDGRAAKIDFSGPEVQYSGDLPVNESAKIFFDAVGGYVRAPCSK